MIPGSPYRINQVSWQLRPLTGSPPLHSGVGGRMTTPGPGAPCKALQGTILPAAYLPPRPVVPFWVSDAAQTFVTSRHTTAWSRYGDLASVSGWSRPTFGNDGPMETEGIVPKTAEWILSAALNKAGFNTRNRLLWKERSLRP